MRGFEQIIEERIRLAQQRGELDVPELAGCPLPMEDDALVPAEQRMALRVLKNAGYVPEEVMQLREVDALIAVAAGGSEGESRRAASRLDLVLARLEQGGLRSVSRAALLRYREALLQRMSRSPGA